MPSSNEYLTEIERDAGLSEVIGDKLPELALLSPVQIEKLVFYLKSLHTYYPKSENHVAYYAEFSKKLEELRNTPEQIFLQRQAKFHQLKGLGCALVAGLLSAVALACAFASQVVATIVILLACVALLFFAEGKFLVKAILLSKEQDRKYFLSSVRAAKACNELDWAGLFTYNGVARPGPQSDADLERIDQEIGRLSGELRAALYNDEFFQYSNAELRPY